MLKLLSQIKSALLPDPDTKAFMRFNRKTWQAWGNPGGTSEILVELYPVTQTVISFSYFANILARRHGARIKSFASSTRPAFLYKLRHRALYSIYKSFNAVGQVNTGTTFPDPDPIGKIEGEFRRIRDSLRSKWDIFRIEVEGCPIGSDIYEAFLMDFRRSTIEPGSEEFGAHLKSCLLYFYFWKHYLESRSVKAVILSHGLYKYGILKKLCIQKKIPVYLPTARSMVYISKPEELGNPKFESYHEHFSVLPEETRNQGLSWAKAQLERRLSGEVGVDMHYQVKSAYGKTAHGKRILEDSPKLKVLIATHCFFDNPNAYGQNLFPDFQEWLEFLGTVSEETDYEWYLKTHPDVLPGNNEILETILSRFPRIKRIPESASHHQLREEGISVVLTVYGSIGHEYPLMGKQVVNAGMNPHFGYDFNFHPRSVEEYRKLLLNLGGLDKKIDLVQLYEFYFMHYRCNVCEHLFFRSFSDFCAKLTTEQQNSSAAFRYFIEQLSDSHHKALLGTIEEFLDSSDYKYFEPAYAIRDSRRKR